jgi:hypothetical protein
LKFVIENWKYQGSEYTLKKKRFATKSKNKIYNIFLFLSCAQQFLRLFTTLYIFTTLFYYFRFYWILFFNPITTLAWKIMARSKLYHFQKNKINLFVLRNSFSQKCEFMCKPVKKWCAWQFWIYWYQFSESIFFEKCNFAETKQYYYMPEIYEKQQITT